MNSTPAVTPIILQVDGIRTRRVRCFPVPARRGHCYTEEEEDD